MSRTTYNILSFLVIGVVVLGGRYFGFTLLERIIGAIVFSLLFELLYQKKLKN